MKKILIIAVCFMCFAADVWALPILDPEIRAKINTTIGDTQRLINDFTIKVCLFKEFNFELNQDFSDVVNRDDIVEANKIMVDSSGRIFLKAE